MSATQIIVSAAITAVAVETIFTLSQGTRAWGSNLVPGVLVALFQAGVSYWLVNLFRKDKTSTSVPTCEEASSNRIDRAHKENSVGILQSIKSNWKKSEAAVVIQKLLEDQARHGLFQADPAKAANLFVARIWDAKPDIFDGKFGRRPHKISVAAIALSAAIEELEPTNANYEGLVIALGKVLQEWKINGAFYSLDRIDDTLVHMALQIFVSVTNGSKSPTVPVEKASSACGEKKADNLEDGIVYLEEFPYPKYEDWYRVYRDSACEVNDALKPTDGLYLLDLLDDAPLRRAFQDKVDPITLGTHFGKNFDMFKIGFPK